MADENCTPSTEGMKALVCVGCGEGFFSKNTKKFCKSACSKRYFKRKYRKQARDKNPRKCVTCNNDIVRKESTGRVSKYCSDQCKPYYIPPIPEDQRRAKCKNCGNWFEKKRKNSFFCKPDCCREFSRKNDKLKSKAKRALEKKRLADSGGYKLNCQWCNEVFSCLRRRKYCTPVCSSKANTEKQKLKAHQSGKTKPIDQLMEERRLKAQAEGRIFNCRNCGKENWRKNESSTNKKAGVKPAFCDVSCMSEWRKKQNPKNDPAYAEQQEKLRLIRKLKFILSHHKRNMEYVEQRVEERHRVCGVCGVNYCDWPLNRMGRGSTNCPVCKDRIDRERAKAQRAKRKAMEQGAKGYAFNVFDVFYRDGWRCQLCGCSSPKRLRGTYHPSAPELDHIKPLSKGGEHTMENTQLLCRSCNAMKSDKPMTWAKRQLRARDLRSLKLF